MKLLLGTPLIFPLLGLWGEGTATIQPGSGTLEFSGSCHWGEGLGWNKGPDQDSHLSFCAWFLLPFGVHIPFCPLDGEQVSEASIVIVH